MSDGCSDLSLLMKAIKFAADKHRLQRRKGGDSHTPYINHPVDVTDLLVRVGKVTDVDVLAAAALHDTIEDTDTLPEEIEEKFGKRVLEFVIECTDDKQLPKSERKRLQVETAPHKSPQAKLIKIADKISNMRDVSNTPPSDWSEQRCCDYLTWSNDVFQGLRGVSPELDQLFEETLVQARKRWPAPASR